MELAKINNMMDSYTKDTPSAKQKSSDKFEKLVAKAQKTLQNQDDSKNQVQTQDNVQNQDNVQTQDNKTVTTGNAKNHSTKLDSKDIKEIKEAVDEIIQDNSKGDLSDDALNLLNMLSMLLGSLQDSTPNTELSADSIVTGLKQKLNLTDAKENKILELLDKLVNTQQFATISENSSKNSTNDIKKELFAMLSSLDKENSESTETNPKDNIISLKEVLPEIKQALASKGNGSENKDEAADKKGDELLKSLASDDKSKNSDPKITNFMNKFTAIQNDKVNTVKEPEVINQKNLAGDIIKTLNYMETNNMKNLTVKINPKELGEVVVNITMEAGVMKASITASNKDAYNLIQSSLQDINTRLNNNDVKISNLSLNVYNEDTTYYSNESGRDNYQQESGRGNRNASAVSQTEEVQDEDYMDSNVNIFA